MNLIKPATLRRDRADYQHPRQVTLHTYASLSPAPAVFQTKKYFKYFKGGLGGNVADDIIADLVSATSENGTITIFVDESAGTYTLS